MALNFPNSPADGDLATLNGTTFQYNAAKNLWDPVTEELTTTSDTPPGSPSNGQTWFDTTNGTLYVYYDDGTSSQWVGVTGPQGENATGSAGSGSSSGGGSGTTVYATLAELPLINVATGSQAFVSETDRLYIWADTGWYNIAIINTSPTITQGGAGSYELATDGTPTVITLTATDPEGIPITWSYSVTSGSLSNGGGTTATVSQADNVFTITPTTTQDYAGSFQLTFTASDGVNLATDTNSFSLVFDTLVQNSKYTAALITTDGSTGNNNTFVNSSTNGATITPSGGLSDPKLTTFSPYRSGGYSVKIDATASSWIYANLHSDFNFGTGDFTVEFWMKSQKSDQWLLLIDQQYQAQGISIWINPSNQLIYYPNSSTPALTSQTLTMTDWIHVALVRSSGTTKFYVNGVWNSTSYSDSQNFNTNLPIKMGSDYSSGSYGYLGYFRDVRVTNTAVYSSDFTPPTEPLTAISGTKLLTCQSHTFKDESSSNHTITVTGSPSIVPVGPYDYNAFNTQLHGGSVYFDGSNFLQAPYHSSFDYNSSTPFTIDMWFYPTVSGTDSQHIAASNTGGTDSVLNWLFRQKADNTLRFVMIDGSGTVVTCDSTYQMKINAWNHVAVIMTGSSIRHWLNGTWQQEVSFSGTQQVNGNIEIGRWGSTYYNGYISDFRYNVGEQLYTGVNQFSIPIPTEPLSSTNSELHIKGTGANIIDKSQINTLTLVNDTTASTTQTKYASSSIYFDGLGDYIRIPHSSGLTVGNNDFTIEAWVYYTSNSPGITDNSLINQSIFGGSSNTNYFFNINHNQMTSYISDGTGWDQYTTVSTSDNQNQWVHVAWVKNGSTLTMYRNGISVGTLAITITMGNSTRDIFIGFQDGGSGYWPGYIEDLRVTNGLARYTSNFTPPTGSLEG